MTCFIYVLSLLGTINLIDGLKKQSLWMLTSFSWKSRNWSERQGWDLMIGILPLVYQSSPFGCFRGSVCTDGCICFVLAIMLAREDGIFATFVSFRRKVRIMLEDGTNSCYEDQAIHAGTFMEVCSLMHWKFITLRHVGLSLWLWRGHLTSLNHDILTLEIGIKDQHVSRHRSWLSNTCHSWTSLHSCLDSTLPPLLSPSCLLQVKCRFLPQLIWGPPWAILLRITSLPLCPGSCVVKIALACFSLIVSSILQHVEKAELSLCSPRKVQAGSSPPPLQLPYLRQVCLFCHPGSLRGHEQVPLDPNAIFLLITWQRRLPHRSSYLFPSSEQTLGNLDSECLVVLAILSAFSSFCKAALLRN